MASVFVLLEAFNRKEAAALGFFPCATASFFLHYGKSGNKLVTLTPKRPQNGKMTAPGQLNFSSVRALFVDKFCGAGR